MSDHKEIPPNKLMLFGIIGGLIGIYLSPYFPTAGALGAICAVIWGAEAVRRVAKYGLGTGVPSIGQLALGMGIIASMFGLAIATPLANIATIASLSGPVIALITASIIGFIIGLFAQHVIKMKIPVMIRCMTEIAAAGSLIIIGLSAAVAGNFIFKSIIDSVFDSGIILAVFWVGAVAILHPFNACLGPDEKQKRLLYLAGSTGAIAMAIIGIASIMTLGATGTITLVLGAVLWLIFYKKFWDEVYKDAATVVGTGLIPKTEA